MTKEVELQYGFQEGESVVKTLFDNIPIYPKVTDASELAKALGTNINRICSLMWQMPANAPVIQDFGIISRLK